MITLRFFDGDRRNPARESITRGPFSHVYVDRHRDIVVYDDDDPADEQAIAGWSNALCAWTVYSHWDASQTTYLPTHVYESFEILEDE